jgi:ubiquinone/menaquinone biosynthesis C-methylase UbiE
MRERRFHGEGAALRSPERLALLDVDRVATLALEGVAAESVCDVGTGSGIFAEAFSKRGLAVTGVDGNAEFLALARGFAPGGTFVPAEAEALPFADRAFDLVFLGHLLHESDRPVGALAEAGRVARLRVAVLEWPYVREEHGPPLAHRLSPERVAELARKAGFSRFERIELRHQDFYRLGAWSAGGEIERGG